MTSTQDRLKRLLVGTPPSKHPGLSDVIAYLDSTDPESWWPGPTYRSPDGTRHCALSHIEVQYGMPVMEWFESRWSTSYMIGSVNDGNDKGYQQESPKERCMAYLRALADGSELSTEEVMEQEYWRWFSNEAQGMSE